MDTGSGRLQVMLERLDPVRNVYGYYVVSLEPSLFGDTALVRQWGRIGSAGRQRLELYADPTEAAEELEAWLRRKVQRGYGVRLHP
jgi:predicted DNA-binding WGR domain protein